jgi:hypothetical protein
VDQGAVERERTEHACRLCGKQAHDASLADLAAMQAEADGLEGQCARDERVRDGLSAAIRRINVDADAACRKIAMLEEVTKRGVDFVLPTDTERSERSRLEQHIGGLCARRELIQQRIEQSSLAGEQADIRGLVYEKVRETLRTRADEQNEDVLQSLSSYTYEMARAFGAQSITDVTCSALGALSLRKHGVRVTFRNINNAGERLRVKLAFFLAMMRLGRQEHGGRHPGFLMIDQPGSAEMVDEDFGAVARVLFGIDAHFADELQILCFTARPQFANATVAGKVYGPQSGQFAF